MTVIYVFIGVALLVGAALLLWLGRPSHDGRSAPFLERTKAHVPYTLAFTALIGFGLAFTIGGIARLF